MDIKTTNIILYCRKWKETVFFYEKGLNLPVLVSKGWFVEFELNGTSRLSVADESRTTIDSNDGNGLTITLEVEDIENIHSYLMRAGLGPTDIKDHPWGAKVLHVFDPEGNRIEFWSRSL